ncbi:MAG TPA: galactose-1-phosphate uridylyltransferase, partial [Lacipirellulaceae bacterium]|nr:galactose-1-phosphate uridylyltransferase [Lacipirellulaceae bacterium]
SDAPLAYVPDCYLCPGNARVHGHRNPQYDSIFVFDNDLPCVAPEAPADVAIAEGIFRSQPAHGRARVVCYSPLHNTTLAEMPLDRICVVLECWQQQYRELGALPEVNHVLIFENKGKAVGVSNPHPHNQIYATNFVFKTIAIEVEAAARHWKGERRTLFEDIVASERTDGRRIIADAGSAIAFVPYFARYAYETYVAPKQPYQSIADLSPGELNDLARVLQNVLVRYDNLWKMSFPYVLVLHQAPTDGRVAEGFHFHIEIHPPLRSPNLLKYLAGPEIGGGNFLSDTSPEAKAAELRLLSSVHYKVAPTEATP